MNTTGPDDNWDLIGHEWAVELLAGRLARQRVGHAYLLTGPPHVGKMTLARRFAQALNCLRIGAGGAARPCDACRTCDLIGRDAHPDVQVIEPEGRTIRIETIRDLQRGLTLSPVEARYRVAIIRDIQDATDHAADALLKTLEEPAPAVKILLTADVAEKVSPTIVSRCQVIPLRPIPPGHLARMLAARHELSYDQALLLARLSGGRPGWAIHAALNPAQLETRALILDRLAAVLEADRTGRFEAAEEMARGDDLDGVLDIWQNWWRDVLLVVEGSQVAPVNADRLADLEQLADRLTPDQARRALRAVRRTGEALSKNANARLALDIMLLDMPYL